MAATKSLRLIPPRGARSLFRPPPPPATPPLPLPLLQQHRRISTTPTRPWLLSALSSSSLASGPSHLPPPKTLTTTRLLPYPPSKIYALIADIDSYRFFLPHCASSRVTLSTPLTNHPALADLTVGWGPFTQTYTSRVYCVPDAIVEAVSGNADPSIPAELLHNQGYDLEVNKRKKMDGIFESLVTRWTVKAVPPPASQAGRRGDWTEVSLSVTFQFANPALGLAVGQLADDKVDEMVVAFEERARRLYGSPKQS